MGRNLSVLSSNKLKVLIFLEILKNSEEKYFQELIFEQDGAPVRKSKISINFINERKKYWSGHD